VEDADLDLNINFLDERHTNMTLNVPWKSLLKKEHRSCELAIYASDSIDLETWYVGTNALKDKVITFDGAKLNEGKEDTLYVGIRHLTDNERLNGTYASLE
jgi:hypothetical protein